MIVLLTPAITQRDEVTLIHQFFDAGLSALHVRKPNYSAEKLMRYVEAIDQRHHAKLVLHSHHHLAPTYGIKRIHIKENDRIGRSAYRCWGDLNVSTSTHDIDVFNELTEDWCYAFLSPIFPSISKAGYGPSIPAADMLKQRKNKHVALIALGGINLHTMNRCIGLPIDGFALHGAVWTNNQPLNYLKKCLQQDPTP